jgi:hypothetical protein
LTETCTLKPVTCNPQFSAVCWPSRRGWRVQRRALLVQRSWLFNNREGKGA